MIINKKLAALAYGLFILVLAACSAQARPLPGTGAGETPDTEAPGVPTEPPDAGTSGEHAVGARSFGEPGAETPVIEGRMSRWVW
jgi:hypothetical protein